MTEPTPEALRAAVRKRADRGVDVIKVMASGGTMTPGTRQEMSQFTADLLRTLVDEAHRFGLPVTAPAHGTDAIRIGLDAGVDGVEHVSFWTADGVDDPGDLVDRIADSGVSVGITAVRFRHRAPRRRRPSRCVCRPSSPTPGECMRPGPIW